MNWQTLVALHKIYDQGEVIKINSRTKRNKGFVSDAYVDSLIHDTKEIEETSKKLLSTPVFEKTYEKYHLHNYLKYYSFLQKSNLLNPQTKFEEEDIKVLVELNDLMQQNKLEDIRKQIIKFKETKRRISGMFFKNEKRLKNKTLEQAVIKILKLNIDELPDGKDQQYLYKLRGYNPKIVVLCENLDFLKMPYLARNYDIELWFAGGYNVSKLKYEIDEIRPIYYSCDWDYDGMKIYALIKEKLSDIKLLFPTAKPKGIVQTDHDSFWKNRNDPKLLSNLDKSLYNKSQIALLEELIESNEWIIEENNDLIEMLKYNKCL